MLHSGLSAAMIEQFGEYAIAVIGAQVSEEHQIEDI
jgi:hypothetical protein